MPNNPPSDFKRNLRREIASYFIVVLCALPVRFWLFSLREDSGSEWVRLVDDIYLQFFLISLIGAVFVSKLRLRYKLILTFLLIAL